MHYGPNSGGEVQQRGRWLPNRVAIVIALGYVMALRGLGRPKAGSLTG